MHIRNWIKRSTRQKDDFRWCHRVHLFSEVLKIKDDLDTKKKQNKKSGFLLSGNKLKEIIIQFGVFLFRCFRFAETHSVIPLHLFS